MKYLIIIILIFVANAKEGKFLTEKYKLIVNKDTLEINLNELKKLPSSYNSPNIKLLKSNLNHYSDDFLEFDLQSSYNIQVRENLGSFIVRLSNQKTNVVVMGGDKKVKKEEFEKTLTKMMGLPEFDFKDTTISLNDNTFNFRNGSLEVANTMNSILYSKVYEDIKQSIFLIITFTNHKLKKSNYELDTLMFNLDKSLIIKK
jgi:hypothetical protein